MSYGKVIGYIAYVTKLQLICEGDSCIVAGSSSRKKMISYLEIARPGSSKKSHDNQGEVRGHRKSHQTGGRLQFRPRGVRAFPSARAKDAEYPTSSRRKEKKLSESGRLSPEQGQGRLRHNSLPDRDVRLPRGRLRQLRVRPDQVQLLPQPPLSDLPGNREGEMGREEAFGASSRPLPPRRVHGPVVHFQARHVQQKGDVRSDIRRGLANASRLRPRPEASRGRNRLPRDPAHVVPAYGAPRPRAFHSHLRRPDRRRTMEGARRTQRNSFFRQGPCPGFSGGKFIEGLKKLYYEDKLVVPGIDGEASESGRI